MVKVHVNTGEVKALKSGGVLHADAIGSCVVVTAHDPTSLAGGMAHVMLPGDSSGESPREGFRYSRRALVELIRATTELGSDWRRIQVCLVGGGNMLGDEYYNPGPEIVQSLTETFEKMELDVAAMDVGGARRRSCALDVGTGSVVFTVGDSPPQTLWAGLRSPVRRNP